MKVLLIEIGDKTRRLGRGVISEEGAMKWTMKWSRSGDRCSKCGCETEIKLDADVYRRRGEVYVVAERCLRCGWLEDRRGA